MTSNALRNGARRIDAHDLLAILVYVSRHGGVTVPELADHISTSESTVRRIIRSARDQFGVSISWHPDRYMETSGEFSVDDWGVFDRHAVLQRFPDT